MTPVARKTTLAISAAIVAIAAAASWHSPSQAGVLDFLAPKTVATAPAAAPADAPAVAGESPAPALGPVQAPNYRAIVRQWGPAVVGITVDGTRHAEGGETMGEESGGDERFFQFFRGLPGFQPHFAHPENQPFRGQGSGFIVSTDGLILTNAHVVRDAQHVTVKFADRREFDAQVLGADPATDIAVLRVKASGLTPVHFGDPRALQVGDYVLAIGTPFGFDQSATAGIVSAKARSLPGDAYVPFIQTDAAVNPGNSGGPLFDAGGNVVGINAQIYTQTGGYQGLSFAIPIDVALHAKDQIVATGHASHARLGVMIQDLNQSLAESFGLSRPDGALVSSVDTDSPAASGGIKPGDVITQIDGTPIERGSDLSNRIGLKTPGTLVSLKVWRDHALRDVDVKLAAAQAPAQEASAGDGASQGRLGLSLRPLTKDERNSAGVDHGLVVEEVRGPAARAGLQPGDLVLGVNGQPATSIEQLRSVARGPSKSVALLIQRDGQTIFVPLQLG
jgi:serine protease Do